LAVARDVNRHRVQSVGEESTRYCNYSKEKFGKELNIIEPIWFTDEEKEILHNESNHMSFQEMCALISSGTDFSVMKQVDYWMFANMACEYAYMMNTTQFGENNWNAQKGSLMLPLDTKTESIHTAFASDWCHFFNLRALGTTGAPRPSAKEVAWPLMNEFIDRQYITLDDIDTEKYYKIIEEFGNNIDEYIKK
jgi:thymidylate synthase (FAD)